MGNPNVASLTGDLDSSFERLVSLLNPNCGGEMRIVSVILAHRVITKILDHLAGKGIEPGRGPPKGS